MKKIFFVLLTTIIISIATYAQQSNQVIVNITAPSCCPSTGLYTPGYTQGIWGWTDDGNSAGQLNYFASIPQYTLTFIYAFPTNGGSLTHVRCITENAKGHCGMQQNEWMLCRDQEDHDVGLNIPNSQIFSLSLHPYSIPTPIEDPDPED